MKKRIILTVILSVGLSFRTTHTVKNIKNMRLGNLPTLAEVEKVINTINWTKLAALAPKLLPLVEKIGKTVKSDEMKEAIKNTTSSLIELEKDFITLKSSKKPTKETTEASVGMTNKLISVAKNANIILMLLRTITDEVADDLVGVLKDTKEKEKIKKFIQQIKNTSDKINKMSQSAPDLKTIVKNISEDALRRITPEPAK